MGLPPLTSEGVLPPGGHDATAEEVRDLFVTHARYRSRDRSLAWAAYLLWAERAHYHFGPGVAWLAGGLLSHRSGDPSLRVLFFPKTPSMVGRAIDKGIGFSLLTVEDVLYSSPAGGWTPRVVPVGGWVDAALGNMFDGAAAEMLWSLSLGTDGTWTDNEAGFVRLEV